MLVSRSVFVTASLGQFREHEYESDGNLMDSASSHDPHEES